MKWLSNFLNKLDAILEAVINGDSKEPMLYEVQPIDPPQTPENAPQPTELAPTDVTRFPQFVALIAQYEGAVPANNNPYNFKFFRGGYLPKYGVVKCSVGGFAMFSTLALGEEYGQTCIKEMIDNHPEWNFWDFFEEFAPVSDDNNTLLYADTIAKEMGTVATTNLKTFLNV